MGILSIALTILSCSTLVQTFFTQSAGIKGVLLCGDKPLVNTKLKLYDLDRGPFDRNDLLAEGTTDSMGQFSLHGHTTETTTIDPQLHIYHDCYEGMALCERETIIKIPKSYVSSGEKPERFLNIGKVNMHIKSLTGESSCNFLSRIFHRA
ncbi:Transthyretin-like family protein [Ancylostoma caninum]|uniref:Transthyretin-like family protein n=1 Tax=Ancylostoma caninum TaxID=29170 RepID=A0A368GTT8_ANCCA|nr:Transthyretin-like family protein [Ancylostoma caninum]